MKQTIIYSLKIWLTSVVASPILYVFLETIQRQKTHNNIEGSFGFILYSIPYGLFLSLPSWLFLWLSTYSLLWLNMGIIVNKLWLSTIGVILTLLPFWLIFGHDDLDSNYSTALWAASYCIVIIGGIWIYKLKLNLRQ